MFLVLCVAEDDGRGRPHSVSPEIGNLCPPLAACNVPPFRLLLNAHGLTNRQLDFERHD
jgi:hypothetical protein